MSRSNLKRLADTGAGDLLRKTGKVLRRYGWTKGFTYNPNTGGLDVEGALCVAAGAKVWTMKNGGALEDCVPIGRCAMAWVAWEALSWAVNTEPSEWQDAPERTIEEVLAALDKAAQRLDIALN